MRDTGKRQFARARLGSRRQRNADRLFIAPAVTFDPSTLHGRFVTGPANAGVRWSVGNIQSSKRMKNTLKTRSTAPRKTQEIPQIFLGQKLLGELRILMRLSSGSAAKQGTGHSF